jgi:hypothetical protein
LSQSLQRSRAKPLASTPQSTKRLGAQHAPPTGDRVASGPLRTRRSSRARLACPLEADLLELARTVEAVVGRVSPYGTKYEMHATLTGPNGRTAAIVAVWIVRSDEDFPSFVTAYPD